jgi:hypothetical protein
VYSLLTTNPKKKTRAKQTRRHSIMPNPLTDAEEKKKEEQKDHMNDIRFSSMGWLFRLNFQSKCCYLNEKKEKKKGCRRVISGLPVSNETDAISQNPCVVYRAKHVV